MHDLSRTLTLIPYIQANPGVSTAELAELLGATEKEIVSELQVLWMCGLPGQAGGDIIDIDVFATDDSEDDDDPIRPGQVFLSNADYLTRPLRLTPDEALSLTLALDFASATMSSELASSVESARAKLRTALGSRALDSGAAMVAGGEPGVRDALVSAIAEHRVVTITHDGLRRTSTPVVEPARIFVRDGFSYLQAWSRSHRAWRNFRMERIVGVSDTGESFDLRPAPDIGAGSWGAHLDAADEVTLTVDTSARWIIEYFPILDVEGDRVRMAVTSLDWLAGLLLRLGPAVRGVEPAAAAQSARQAAIAALARYATVTSSGISPGTQ